MFSLNTSQSQPAGGSLFGSTQNKPLFGVSTNNNKSQPASGQSLFGASLSQPQQSQTHNQQPGSTSLFGTSAQAAPTSTSLFSQTQPGQNMQQSQGGGGLFGNLTGNTQSANTLGGSFLGASTTQQSQNLQQSRLGMSLADTMNRREKSIPDQMETVLRKWSPDSRECLMQHYFYNTVTPGTAMFHNPSAEDDEAKWEEALKNKPSENAVPVLARGFQQLGQRLSLQVQAVQQLQMRLHEMNNSLDAMMEKHELNLNVRAVEAKRKHIALSQKCLGLAIKVQVLRSRGFVLDGVEEELRKKLSNLEMGVFDPGFSGREEEIWARMVSLRERTRWLQSETEKLGKQNVNGEGAGIDEEVLRKTKKILSDYDAQITHLRKELEQVHHEYSEWEAASKPSRAS